MAWMNNDGLNLKYGTSKATVGTAGDYSITGGLRETEITIDLTTLTTSAVIQSDTVFFPAGMLIEQVDVVADVAAVGGTTFSVGLVNLDRTTALSTTAFVAAMVTASVDAVGEKNILNVGSTYAGAYIGSTSASPGHITALAAGTYTAGKVKLRIKYRMLSTITQ